MSIALGLFLAVVCMTNGAVFIRCDYVLKYRLKILHDDTVLLRDRLKRLASMPSFERQVLQLWTWEW